MPRAPGALQRLTSCWSSTGIAGATRSRCDDGCSMALKAFHRDTSCPQVELLRFSGPDELARAAACEWLSILNRPVAVALSGGRIYKQFFNAVVELARETKADFTGVDFFWADERCVPPEDPESNYRLAR